MQRHEPTGEELKQQGLALVEINNPDWLKSMRSMARMIARRNGTVCADDLREYSRELEEVYGLIPKNSNAWGGIFGPAEFVHIGYTKSKHKSNHGRPIGFYRLDESKIKTE